MSKCRCDFNIPNLALQRSVKIHLVKFPKLTASLLWPIVVLVIALVVIWAKPWQVKPTETITVSAQGKTEAVPTIAKITASIQSTNQNLDAARAENQTKVDAIITKLKTLGIGEKDIKTSYISAGNQGGPMIYMRPQNYSPSPQMTTNLEITIRDFKIADNVISTLTQNSATNIYGPQLTIDDSKLQTAKSEARQNAVDNAKKQASDLAQASGRKVGKVVKITEQGNFGYPMPMMAVNSADLETKASQIQPGQNDVTINLQVDFELK